MKNLIKLIIILTLFSSCLERKTDKKKIEKNAVESNSYSLLDSLKSICRLNTIDTFDIERLRTDSFKNMTLIDKKLFQTIYPQREDFIENSFFIYSYLPSGNDYLTLIIYQKNIEGENYRVDYIDLVNIDSTGKQIEKIRLTAKDSEVITYEVVSFLNNDTLKVLEKISTEPYFDPDLDTLFINQITYKLNGQKRIDTLEIKSKFKVRKY